MGNSIILNNIREFINKRQYKNMIYYVKKTAPNANASENTKDYIISALIDALVWETETQSIILFNITVLS